MLCCPVCKKGDLRLGENAVCQSPCGATFPIVDDVPVLINEANSVFLIADFVDKQRTTQDIEPSKAKRLMRSLIPSISLNLKAKANFLKFAELLIEKDPDPAVLVIGGSTEGNGMQILRSKPEIALVETDVSFGPQTALICDAHDIPFKDGTFDGVIAQAVLEHVVDPFRCAAEIHRVLKPQGLVYAETPFMQQVHAGRYDFLRFTHLGHRRLFRDFDEIESGTCVGPATALLWSIQYFLVSFVRSKPARLVLIGLSSLALFWLKYLDHLIINTRGSLDAASGYYFLGSRGEAALSDRELIAQYRGLG